ncbi:succinate dehydrogenase, hydrophobic membrane anchor protein [Sphingomonas colocasiae]|uniref:Succinate dehydrogenase hydrophobic membrane anchor subunit n=1 Tax=Sphingomonas colocasiae TaxID=1848973 RepID=A0ABS7PRT3_9SPHN|nr:succinate dehydrogenase, hydrophobic membrane anchor protein [Sphingomonas colocasiae]MBY8824051.1 succinate dehydrogenase, hydrophobic membrane anchor protein [Sphingomonas colocasiae]
MGSGTGIGRVRGLGSAKHGSHHWLIQRMTALGNLVLLLWFIFSLVRLPGFDHGTVVAWLSSPLAAVPMMLLIVSVFWHLRIGMQVMIEDYVHDDALRVLSIVLLNFYAIGGAALGVFSIARIAFGGAPA